MAHAHLFGFEVEGVVGGGLHLDGDALGDLDAELLELVDLVGVVGEQTHGLDAELPQDLGPDEVFAFVSGKAQGQVGLEGVHALLLELVGLEFVDQADPAALLAHVEEDAAALFFDLCQGGGQLLAAVAAQGAEGVAGQAFGVDAAEDVAAVADLTLDEGDVVFAVEAVDEAVGAEISEAGGQADLCHAVDQVVVAFAVVLEFLDAQEGDAPFFRQGLELCRPHHGAVLAHDLAAQAAGAQARQAAEVDGGLGVAVAFQDAVGFGQEGEHVARSAEVLGLGVVGHAGHGGHGPLLCRNAGRR